MISIDNYSLIPEANKITINLPQVIETAECTIWPLDVSTSVPIQANRKIKLSDEEYSAILCIVKRLYEDKEEIKFNF